MAARTPQKSTAKPVKNIEIVDSDEQPQDVSVLIEQEDELIGEKISEILQDSDNEEADGVWEAGSSEGSSEDEEDADEDEEANEEKEIVELDENNSLLLEEAVFLYEDLDNDEAELITGNAKTDALKLKQQLKRKRESDNTPNDETKPSDDNDTNSQDKPEEKDSEKEENDEPVQPQPKKIRTLLRKVSTFAIGAAAGSAFTIATLIATAPKN